MSSPLNEAGKRWDDDYGLDPRATVKHRPCKHCGGSGVGGYVSREMAFDAGAPEMEGQSVTCWFCNGDGVSRLEGDDA